jgi:hypothetical protein
MMTKPPREPTPYVSPTEEEMDELRRTIANMPTLTDVQRKLVAQHAAAQRRKEQAAIRMLLDAIQAGNVEDLVTALVAVDELFIWPGAWAAIAKLPGTTPGPIREAFYNYWIEHGDHLRGESSDLVLIHGLRKVMLPYTGGPLTLYRGDGWANRQHRTYGLSWTADRDIADSFAQGICRTSEGGSALLATEAPANAIICAPHRLNDRYEEAEYVVDRTQLRDVRVLARYPQLSPEEYHKLNRRTGQAP